MELSKLTGNRYTRLAAAVGAGVGTVALLTGCGGENRFAKGGNAKVIGHDYSPAHTYYMPMLVGKIVMLMPEHADASWSLEVEQCGRHDKLADKNGCVTGDIDVSEQTYDEYPVGSTIGLTPSK